MPEPCKYIPFLHTAENIWNSPESKLDWPAAEPVLPEIGLPPGLKISEPVLPETGLPPGLKISERFVSLNLSKNQPPIGSPLKRVETARISEPPENKPPFEPFSLQKQKDAVYMVRMFAMRYNGLISHKHEFLNSNGLYTPRNIIEYNRIEKEIQRASIDRERADFILRKTLGYIHPEVSCWADHWTEPSTMSWTEPSTMSWTEPHDMME